MPEQRFVCRAFQDFRERHEIPRVSGKGGIQANWRAITGVNINNLSAGVSPGNRGGVIAVSTKDYTAAYKGLGLESNVDFEADYAAEGFDDAKARAVEGLLRSLMISEEKMMVGGNSSVLLGTTPTPTAAGATTGGALSNGIAWAGKEGDASGVSVDIGKIANPLMDWALEVKYTLRELASSMQLGKPLDALPASPRQIGALLAAARPAASAVSDRRWANVRSLVGQALAAANKAQEPTA